MISRIPMGRGAISEKKFYLDKRTNTPYCKEHGAMNVVSVVEKDGKKVYWYRCLTCRIGLEYDQDPSTNESWVETRE